MFCKNGKRTNVGKCEIRSTRHNTEGTVKGYTEASIKVEVLSSHRTRLSHHRAQGVLVGPGIVTTIPRTMLKIRSHGGYIHNPSHHFVLGFDSKRQPRTAPTL